MKRIIITEDEKKNILKMHNSRRIMEQGAEKKQTPVADFNEGVVIPLEGDEDCENKFNPSCMEGKTINLYDDAAQAVWDETWRINSYEYGNYNKLIGFLLDKKFPQNSELAKVFGMGDDNSTAKMLYNCMEPDYYTIEGTKKYNNGTTNRLKTQYCPAVLNVKPGKADFAQNKGNAGGNASVA
jgi:hypothetical protein